jgi:hypothetical protein
VGCWHDRPVTTDAAQHEWIAALVRSDAPSHPVSENALLVDYPVALGCRQRQDVAGLLRELQLVVIGSRQPEIEMSVPLRLLALAEGITATYGAQLDPAEAEMDRAAAAGEETTVLRYELLPVSRDVVLQYAVAMAEVDEFCRRAALITLATPPVMLELRRWTVEELVRQYDGQPPRPWGQRVRLVGQAAG